MCKKNFSFQKNVRNTQYINIIKVSNQETFFRSHLKVDLKNVSMIACVDSGENFVGGLGGEGGICILINTEHRLTNAEFRSGILVLIIIGCSEFILLISDT